MKCILNVTDHEYDKILQMTHDAVEWRNTDAFVLKRIAAFLGRGVAAELKAYDEIRMEKYDDISDLPRVEPAPELLAATPPRRVFRCFRRTSGSH